MRWKRTNRRLWASAILTVFFGLSSQFVAMIDRPTMGSGTYPSVDQLRDTMKNAGVLVDSIDSDPSRNSAGFSS